MGAQQCGVIATLLCLALHSSAVPLFYTIGWLLSTWSQGCLAAPQRPDAQSAKGIAEVRAAARHSLVERVDKLLQVAAQEVQHSSLSTGGACTEWSIAVCRFACSNLRIDPNALQI